MRKSILCGAVACGSVALVAGGLPAAVVKDHVSRSSLWNGIGVIAHFLDPSPDFAAVGAAAIVGNGEDLARVGIVWAQASPGGTPNGGNINEIRYRFRYFPDTSSFSISAVYDQPPEPNWTAVYATPVNSGWSTVIGHYLGYDLRYSEVDVSGLQIRTVSGESHIVALVPESKLAVPQTITKVSLSVGGAGAIGVDSDWYHSNLAGVGPEPLQSIGGYAGNYLAYKVTTVPSENPADFDRDGDVDLADFGGFSVCYNGPNRPPAQPTGCVEKDFDHDGDVDLTDFGWFAGCFNGPNQPPACP